MKKFFATTLVLLLCLSSFTAVAEDKKTLKARVENMSNEQKEARYTEMKLRVEEIKNMDKSALSKDERKALRNELKDLNQEAKAIGRGGIYISTLALVVIVVLLILLL